MLTRTKPMGRGTKGLSRAGIATRPRAHAAAPDRAERLAERAQRAMHSAAFTAESQKQKRTPASVKPATVALFSGVIAPIKKELPLRSETYRRLVAAMPCAWCGIAGYSQHAHENEGKGARLKVDDRRSMPLCCARPDIEGCHTAFDQYRLVPGGRQAHIELGRAMAQRTRRQIKDAGQWPAKVPQWQDGGSDAI